MKEKSIDLENGFELVIEGDYEILTYTQEILASFGGDGSYRLYVRRKKEADQE